MCIVLLVCSALWIKDSTVRHLILWSVYCFLQVFIFIFHVLKLNLQFINCWIRFHFSFPFHILTDLTTILFLTFNSYTFYWQFLPKKWHFGFPSLSFHLSMSVIFFHVYYPLFEFFILFVKCNCIIFLCFVSFSSLCILEFVYNFIIDFVSFNSILNRVFISLFNDVFCSPYFFLENYIFSSILVNGCSKLY